MHIEPGILSPAKIAFANVAAVAVLGAYLPALVKRLPHLWRTAMATVFFSLFMQAFHMKVGPSELHFVGAMPIYLAFGFLPTLFGFALGLLMQGMLFEPQDLVHLGVNTLSLAVPLIVLHHAWGRKLASVHVQTILKLDAAYYAGVTLMVGFWLGMGEVATPFSEWLHFASSYLVMVAFEPVVTVGVLWLIRRYGHIRVVASCFSGSSLAAGR